MTLGVGKEVDFYRCMRDQKRNHRHLSRSVLLTLWGVMFDGYFYGLSVLKPSDLQHNREDIFEEK